MSKTTLAITVYKHNDYASVDVHVDGTYQGGGTGPTIASALDVAMDILYGTKNDNLNGDYGILAELENA